MPIAIRRARVRVLAGVGGIDAALFVVAADEGVMPQTREHFEICRLLETKTGITRLRGEVQEQSLAGFCYTGELAPTSRRPLDLLNSPEMVLLLFHDNKLTLVNKHTISHAILG